MALDYGDEGKYFHFVFSSTDSIYPNHHEESLTHVTNPVMSFNFKSDIMLYSVHTVKVWFIWGLFSVLVPLPRV
jgi:hypothetical protein